MIRVLIKIVQLFIFPLTILFALNPGLSAQDNSGGVLSYDTRIVFDGNTITEEVSYILFIGSKEFDWLSEIDIPYKNSDKLEINEAMVLNQSGVILRKLTKKEIETRSDISDGSLYEDDMVKSFTLRWNEYPYYVKYAFSRTRSSFIRIKYWSPVVYPAVSVGRATLKVEIPFGLGYKTDSRGDFDFSLDSLSKGISLQWTAKSIKPVKPEKYSPTLSELLPFVDIVPESFEFSIPGRLDSWESFGKWQYDVLSPLLELPESEKLKISQLTAGVTDRKEIIRRIYHNMQDNTRYINVAIDEGGLVPYPATYVCQNRYGDCKALTVYMMAALKYLNIDSFYTLVFAGDNPIPVRPNFPSPQFNHVMLCVPVGPDTLWLENTSSIIPFGYTGSFTQDRHCLIVKEEGSVLVRRPELKPDEVESNTEYRISPGENGEATVKIRREVRGNVFERYLQIKNEITEKEKEEEIREIMGLKNEILSFNIIQNNRDEDKILIDAEIKSPSAFRKIGSSLLFTFSQGIYLDIEQVSERKLPLRINYPVSGKEKFIIEKPLSGNYEARLPEDIILQSGFGECTFRFSKSGDAVVAERSIRLNPGTVEPEVYKEFYEFIQSIKQAMRKSGIIFNQVI